MTAQVTGEQIVEEYNRKLGFYTIKINRVPKKTYEQFRDLADNDSFCKDYGFFLKHVLDFYTGVLAKGTEHLEVEIETLRQEIELLKLNVAESLGKKEVEEKVVSTLSGRKIKIG